MKVTVVIFCCLLVAVCCQTQHKNGNPTGEIGQPAFDEIIVESTLTVRGKSGSRSGKSLITTNTSQIEKKQEEIKGKNETSNIAGVVLSRRRRALEKTFKGGGRRNFGGFPFGQFGNNFPSSSSSAAQASSNAFNSNTPFGNFGASASQSASQSQSFGPGGFQASVGQSAAQTYYLPNGNKIDVSFSNSFAVNPKGSSGSNSHSLTLTLPDGTVKKLSG